MYHSFDIIDIKTRPRTYDEDVDLDQDCICIYLLDLSRRYNMITTTVTECMYIPALSFTVIVQLHYFDNTPYYTTP